MKKSQFGNKSLRQYRHRKGEIAELAASLVLNIKGYGILARRYRCPTGEIDLIAKRSKTILFVEVKIRPTLAEALVSITRRQQIRIVRAAEYWIAESQYLHSHNFRFDVIALAPWTLPRHLKNAFQSDF